MESYIIRIYRYQPENREHLVGVLKKPGIETQMAFTNIEELWSLLKQSKNTESTMIDFEDEDAN